MSRGGATSSNEPGPNGRAREGRPGPNGQAVPVAVVWDERQRRPERGEIRRALLRLHRRRDVLPFEVHERHGAEGAGIGHQSA